MTLNRYQYRYARAANTATVIAWFKTGTGDGVSFVGIRRAAEPFAGKIALPGGFHDPNTECLEETAARELREETGIDVYAAELELVCVQSDPKRDPREHVIDHVYSVEITRELFDKARAGDDAAAIVEIRIPEGLWVPNDLGLVFDHNDSVSQFWHRLPLLGDTKPGIITFRERG